MLRSYFPSVSRGLVYINIPGRTCLHELFIEYEQVTAWESRFFLPTKLEANYLALSAAVCTGWFNGQAHKSSPLQFGKTSNNELEGTIGRVADTAHTGSFITRRSHLNLLWIYIVLSTPMIYKSCRFISWSNMKSFKPTPRVTLRLGGYDDMTQQILPVSAKLRTPGRWRER